ncbi:hypothetical protein PVAND_014146 [Polypedilum vanderplanki]|uniref:N-acetyllactosaminide beta-1,3-N-acetylglucosaminyltransferase n=1 Tax=Polypedilum vanderplanki TaxID=319348 RepID=A0A9J6CRG0_POLVA|nr:hypothetical protein PVAND_014146 [Polypedilum vanderplanki]
MFRNRRIEKLLKILIIFVFAFFVILICMLRQQSDTENDNTIERIPRQNESEVETALSTASKSLKKLIKCKNKIQKAENISSGKFFIFKNYKIASKHFDCYDSITYVTHSDFTFLNNVVPLLQKWNGPLSLAIYAPGSDFTAALEGIFYLQNCHKRSYLVKKFTTFHLFFDESLLNVSQINHMPMKCSESKKYLEISQRQTFRTKNKLSYPINTARNLARSASITHFVLVSDIELYPNPQFINEFLEMIFNNENLINHKNVFVLPVFEIVQNQELPNTKYELQQLYLDNKIHWFHKQICLSCHLIPFHELWLIHTKQQMQIHSSVKRQAPFSNWEPIFVGTNADPWYDERLSWEGKSDKMTQAYIMCVLDYNFNVLSNGFLIHKPGIKTVAESARPELEDLNHKIIKEIILPEIRFLYGENENCEMYT